MASKTDLPVLQQNVSRDKVHELVREFAQKDMGKNYSNFDGRFPVMLVEDKYGGFDVFVILTKS